MTSLRLPVADEGSSRLDEPGHAWVVRSSPEDGAAFVLRDTPVLLRLSHPVDPSSIETGCFRVLDPLGEVPADLSWSGDGHVLIWHGRRLLVPGVEHVVAALGLRDRRGRAVAEHRSRFVPCGLSSSDLSGG